MVDESSATIKVTEVSEADKTRDISRVKTHPWFDFPWHLTTVLLVISLIAFLYGFGWELQTRSYLKGFSDAVVPSVATPEQKVAAILAWMSEGPARQTTSDMASLDVRNPEETLNYQQLLAVCGSATNAFLNLGSASGLQVRRLLLLGPDRKAKHVVTEVWMGGKWAVVDPAFRTVLRGAQGELLTAQELRDPSIFEGATSTIPNYLPAYSYEQTVHVRLGRIPVFGDLLRQALNKIVPGWEESFNWSLIVERESLAWTVGAGLLLLVATMARSLLGWYGGRRLGSKHIRLRTQLRQATVALLTVRK